MTPLSFLFAAVILAVIPAALWTRFYLRRHPVDRRLAVWTTVGGMAAVAPILTYEALFKENPALDIFAAIHSISAESWKIYLLVFLVVAVLEELMKHAVICVVDAHKKEWRSVADGIEFSILAAIGFAFLENIIYFVGILKMSGYAAILVPFLFRSAFSMFGHTVFSALYGYHFAMGKFAAEVMVDEVADGHRFWATRHLYRMLRNPVANRVARTIVWVGTAGIVGGILFYLAGGPLAEVDRSFFSRWGETIFFGGIGAVIVHLALILERHLARLTMPDIFAEEQAVEGLLLAVVAHLIFNFALWAKWTFAIPGYLALLGWYILWELKQRENLLDLESEEELREKVLAFAAGRGKGKSD